MSKILNIKEVDTKFKIYNKSQTHAEIVIYSQIGQSWFEEGITANTFHAELKELPESVKTIDVRINSPGGDVFDGITIYNRLKQHKAKVTVYVDGLAASIASIIAMAGDEIIMSEGSLMMVHKPMTMAYGNSVELEEVIQRLDDVEEQLTNIYKRRTMKDRSEIKKMLAEETWMSADEAVEMGFADRVMETEETLNIAACSNLPWMKNAPQVDNSKAIKRQLNKFKEDVEGFLAR